MNALAPYAAFFMRLAVGGVFLSRGLDRVQGGIPYLSLGTLLVLIVIAIETVGAVCVLLGMWTRGWATAMATYSTWLTFSTPSNSRALSFELIMGLKITITTQNTIPTLRQPLRP